MTIIDALRSKSQIPSDEVKIELKLYNLADDLVKKARNHLKRITNVLPEFDIHDERHSEKVISNIERLLGEGGVNRLSSYELFFLQLSAFFHDCAMAPSEWELNVLKLTEGNERFKVIQDSLAHDLKEPLKIAQAIEIIQARKSSIYVKFDPQVKDWLFSPRSEDALVEYLASMMVEYQNHRNGFAEQLRSIDNPQEFDDLNTFIRTDYIRATHHIRIQDYVENLEEIFGNSFEQPAWGKRLAKDLALICRSHGEDISYLESFSTAAQYYGAASANLQLTGMLLRLGDIIHFSFDRAPLELRSSRIFKSEFSFLQWALKNNGANYTIDNGKISFRAYCDTPEIYFKLHQYLDWIEVELQNYFRLDRQWPSFYKDFVANLQDKIDRTNITNDESVFLPKRGLSFTLNQKRIIELLMGVGLYKNKFASLRELYQNSLDACRCMISNSNSLKKEAVGEIEFSIERTEKGDYLCCKDNGIGMTKEVIENYLLKIGNSYYKSSDFYRQQAQWGGAFTPTSQFGIGILSCFMIGNKIDIVTKTKTGDYVSCSINGPHEQFYYRNTSATEREQLLESGTVVKVLLSETVQISTHPLSNLMLLMMGKPSYFPEQFATYQSLYEGWENHLYNIIDSFVIIQNPGVAVRVRLEDGSWLPIHNKPTPITVSEFEVAEADFPYLDFLNNSGRFQGLKIKYSEIKGLVHSYEIDLTHEAMQYRTTLTLPIPGAIDDNLQVFYAVPRINGTGICVDGIDVHEKSISIGNYYTDALYHDGIVNFIGEDKPQLTVDRTSLVGYPTRYEENAEGMVEKLLKEIISITRKHIEQYKFQPGTPDHELLWKFVLERVRYAMNVFINELSYTDYGNIVWPGVEKMLNQKTTIRDFIKQKKWTIENFDLTPLDSLTKKLVLFKLISAKRISISGHTIHAETDTLMKVSYLGRENNMDHNKILIKADQWSEEYKEFDIVSSLYPIIPTHLFDSFASHESSRINERLRVVNSFSNGVTAFFDQDPALVHESLGMYTHTRDMFEKEVNTVYEFQNKRSGFWLNELNRFGRPNASERTVVTAFIAPRQLTQVEQIKLESLKHSEPSYYIGVTTGWSILALGTQEHNMIILAGKRTRQELIARIPDDFWSKFGSVTFKFPDGMLMQK